MEFSHYTLTGEGLMDRKTFLILLLVFIVFLSGCGKRTVEKGTFYTAGVWDIPPAYHGNPWAPGGVGVAGAYVHEPLFVYNPKTGQFIDRLGKSFTESDDHKTLTVELKKGVLWHDGYDFTSKDVKTTFYIGYLRSMEVWRNLEDVECPDKYTVVFKWKKVSPTNTIRALTERITSPYHIFGQWADMIPEIRKEKSLLSKGDKEMQKTYARKERKVREVLYKYHPEMPIGTGPFKIKRVTASDMLLVKFKDYYDAKNVHIDKIRIMRWASNEVVWSYLMAGEVDAVSPACPYDVAQEIQRRNPSIEIITPSDMSEYGLIFNCTRPPTSDLNFRRAIAHILDRDMIRKVAYYYGDTVENYSVGIPKSFVKRWLPPEFFKGLTKYDLDRKKAEEILKSAGYKRDPSTGIWKDPSGKEIHLEICAPSGLTDLVLLADASSAQLTKFGIPTQVRTVPLELFSSSIRDHKFDMAAENGAQMSKYGHPSISYNRFFMEGGLIKTASGIPDVLDYKGEKVNTYQLAMELNQTIDPEKEKEIVEKLAWIANEELPFLTCYEKRIMIFVDRGIRVVGWPKRDDPIWSCAPGGVEMLYSTLIVKGYLKPAP